MNAEIIQYLLLFQSIVLKTSDQNIDEPLQDSEVAHHLAEILEMNFQVLLDLF